jgi:pimeloyl-ACP methyl ester carboxylesterase
LARREYLSSRPNEFAEARRRRAGPRHSKWVGWAAYNDYLRCFRDPAAIQNLGEDYRAAASIGLAHDAADLNKKIQCPLLVLWSEKEPFHCMFDVLETWKDRAGDVNGKGLAAGHFMPEQIPKQLVAELKPFLKTLMAPVTSSARRPSWARYSGRRNAPGSPLLITEAAAWQ